ncbi:dienelactone hydrolase family protein [Chitinibacteraceae bacterium HSL-7]
MLVPATLGLSLIFGAWSAMACAAEMRIPGPKGVQLPVTYLPPPAGAIKPAPAVVFVVHCDGPKKDDALAPRYRHMAEMFQELGYAVLIPDSYAARGRGPQCTRPLYRQQPSASRVADDVQWGISWLRARADVDATRIGAVGWSTGGTAALMLAARKTAGLAVVATFYPACEPVTRLRRNKVTVPSLVLMGESDDWFDVTSCRQLDERDDSLHLVTYPQTFHEFDVPGRQLKMRTDIHYGRFPKDGVTLGGNPTVAGDAYRRLFRWFDRWLG